MKNFTGACVVFAILFGLMLWVGTPAHSQEDPGTIQCAPYAQINSDLKKDYGETITAGGILGPNLMMYMTVNPKTHSFTILMRRPNGLSCIVMAGDGFALADPAAAKPKGSGM